MTSFTVSDTQREELLATIETAPGLPVERGSQVLSIDVSRRVVDYIAPGISMYVREIVVHNDRFGLIAKEDVSDGERVFRRHILDSVSAWLTVAHLSLLTHRRRIYDLGSGAGLPGLPLALVLAAISRSGEIPSRDGTVHETVLVERKAKRIAFLRGTVPITISSVATDYRPTVRILEKETRDLGTTESSNLTDAIVVFRAYQQTTPLLLSELATVFPSGTPICALKGRRDQTRAELEIVKNSPYVATGDGLSQPVIEPTVLPIPMTPGSPERSLLVWMTQQNTD